MLWALKSLKRVSVMKSFWAAVPLTLLLCVTATSSHAEIFRYANKKGDTVFTDRLMKKPGFFNATDEFSGDTSEREERRERINTKHAENPSFSPSTINCAATKPTVTFYQ